MVLPLTQRRACQHTVKWTVFMSDDHIEKNAEPVAQLTAAEQQLLRQRLRVCAVANLLLLGLLLGVFVLLALRMQLPSPWDRGQAWLLLALLLGWSGLLRRQPARWRALRQDRRRGRVATVHGSSVVLPRRGIGWFTPLRYQLLVAEQIFAADGFDLLALRPGQSVSVRFLPTSHLLLAVQLAPAVAERGDSPADIAWTPRERDLLSRLAAGQSDKIIARECGLSPATVRTYNSAIFRKLGVNSRQEAVLAARQAGLLVVD